MFLDPEIGERSAWLVESRVKMHRVLVDVGGEQGPMKLSGIHKVPKVRTIEFWSLVFSVVWIAGIGSVIGLVLGVRSMRRGKVDGFDKGTVSLAYAGVVLGIIGIVIAFVVWTHLSGVNSLVRSPSYVNGQNFATARYPSATSEISLCAVSNVPPHNNATQWIAGCRSGWYVAGHSFSTPGMPGLNVG